MNFSVCGTYKNVGLHQADFTVWVLKFGSCLCLFGWAYAAQQAWSSGANAKYIELECELVEWLAGEDGAEASLYRALPCASPVILCMSATVFMFVMNVSV